MGAQMFNRELKRRVKELEADVKELRTRIYCLRDVHEWTVAQGMVIRCRHCHKQAEKMPDAINTQPKGLGQ